MVTFAQLLNAQPSSLAEAAETWELRAKDMGRRAAEIEAEVLGLLTRWSGSASQAAIQKLNELVEKLTDAHTAMQHVSDILDPAGRAITAAQADLVGAVEYAHRSGLTVEDDGSVSWLDWNPLEWGKDRETAQHASDLIQDALRRANEADAEAAADLRVAQFVAQDKASVSALSMSDDPQVEKAVEGFHELLDEAGSFELDGNRDKLQEITNIIQCLSPTEREAFLAQLSDEDLRTLQQHMRGTSDVLWRENGLPHWERLDLESSLLSAVSGQGVDRLSSVWSQLQPTPPEGSEYQKPGGPLDDGDRSWRDVDQGGVGDCWALATLAGKGTQDPSFYDGMVRPNPNGTVSIRLYDDDGNPHWLTVTGDLPVNENGNLAGAAGDSDHNAENSDNWPAYVEKALARGYEDGEDGTSGYENINADWPDQSVEILTGGEAHNIDATDVSTADIGRRIDSGQVVIISTEGVDNGPDMYVHSNESGNLVGGHAYFVKDVLPDGRVVLGNPWGPDGPDGEIILSQEEIREYGTKVTMEG